jgi:two-component system sensor histidine kinase BarA
METLTDLSSMPIIDWEMGTRLAGNNRELAQELLAFLCKTLPDEMAGIKQAYQDKQYGELLKRTHKTHGGVCYCGLPRLKTLLAAIETDLKKNKFDDLGDLIARLESEVGVLLSQKIF